MYVRDAKNREEVWLLDRIEESGLEDPAFRSRDYVIALDEGTNTKAGFGRIRVHKDEGEEWCELAFVFTLPAWRDQGVGAHVVERLLTKASDEEFDRVYTFTVEPDYFLTFGFKPVDSDDLPEILQERLETVREERGEDAIAMRIQPGRFRMPDELREQFKRATPADAPDEVQIEETAEDFGIDPEETTYKYDTGR
ncbi:GNAT family N-acetyltransferase [Halogeometricum borinquense]|uniref:GNAT family N-acetyltransferase n=1 Tax=Halogeometricum borinquense TaxID=60847 RepID=A0A6C0UGK8_9EURY|nr:GNAT family N-acetyltransferase [Halogeometricum borinquense]QIB74555.1 GNAT family N-acetyltransferase [Halogeometricum borinquense]QIQ76500.1 GNAT family N-acetyltransferase [Halogeometricum borinquense]